MGSNQGRNTKEGARSQEKVCKCTWTRAQADACTESAGRNIFVLRTGCQWKALPREYDSGSTVHRTFQKWLSAGFFEKIWGKGLEKYDELEGIGWKWQSLDDCMVKAPLALESVGKNLTDRGKNGDKTQCADG